MTRFSFLGQSGWKSDVSRDAALLFQQDRLRQRLALFTAITLPSLAAQTDREFHHFILTARDLPDWAMAELDAACLASHGSAARFTILASPPSPARRPLREFMVERHGGTPAVAQVVLDDDDGLAVDFIATLRQDLAQTAAQHPDLKERLPFFLSYPLGYGLSLRAVVEEPAALYLHRYPYINAGLTLIGPPDGKNILAIDHRAAPRKYGARLLPGRAMFLRSLHEFNDSRVSPSERWRLIADWHAEPTLAERFACLFAPGAPWRMPFPARQDAEPAPGPAIPAACPVDGDGPKAG